MSTRSVEHYHEEALHLFGMGEIERALHLWRRVLHADPGNTQVASIIAHVEARYLDAAGRERARAQAAASSQGNAVASDPPGSARRPRVDEQIKAAGDSREALSALMIRLHDEGNLEGSLQVAEKLLELELENAVALDYRQRAREGLLRHYLKLLEPLERVPRLNIEKRDVDWTGVHGHHQVLLTRMDERTTLKELMLLSGIPRFEAARTLVSLLQAEAIVLDPPGGGAAAGRRL